jgi:hypothetical protein
MKPHRATAFADTMPVDGRGKRSNETLLRLDEWVVLLIEAVRFFSAGSQRQVAERIREKLAIYRAGRWRRKVEAVSTLAPTKVLELRP